MILFKRFQQKKYCKFEGGRSFITQYINNASSSIAVQCVNAKSKGKNL